MLVFAAVAAMKTHQGQDDKHARIGRWLGHRPLPLLDPGKAPLETTGHF
jgi:hypothetical protein